MLSIRLPRVERKAALQDWPRTATVSCPSPFNPFILSKSLFPVVQRIERRFPNGKVAFLLDFADVLSKILPRASGSDGGYVGPHGIFLNPGDTIELPVNYCMQFVADGSAVFVLNSQTSKEEKLIAELEAKGYQFAINSKPAREREEFQSVIARKKSRSP